MRKLTLTRTEADWLIDLLEDCDISTTGEWPHQMAQDIRQLFGLAQQSEAEKMILEKYSEIILANEQENP